MKKVLDLFSPNKTIDKKTFYTMAAGQGILVLLFWIFLCPVLLPQPLEVLKAWKHLASNGGLIQDLYGSTKLCFHALIIASIVSIIISYLVILPWFRPLGFIMQKLRFIPIAGLTFVFTLASTSGYDLKVKLLVFGIAFFLVDSMISVVKSVNSVEYNHARTIFTSEWRVVYERVVLGKAHQMISAIKQNFAMAWTMLTFVEGLVKSDGGVGALMLNENKHLQLDSVFAVLWSLFILGIILDYLFGVLRNFLCPYADLELKKR
jgi:NitT/TauT family transport system permease protein